MKSMVRGGTLLCCLLAMTFSSRAVPMPHGLNDQNMRVAFEAHAPWNILDGKGEKIGGKITVPSDGDMNTLRADISVQELDYSAGLSAAGRLVALWLRQNPPTPGRFVITKSSFDCNTDTMTPKTPCMGSVDGELTVWGKKYNIDVPIEVTSEDSKILFEGEKEIKWGEYGFGDPDSTIAKFEPVITLRFEMAVPTSGTSKP